MPQLERPRQPEEFIVITKGERELDIGAVSTNKGVEGARHTLLTAAFSDVSSETIIHLRLFLSVSTAYSRSSVRGISMGTSSIVDENTRLRFLRAAFPFAEAVPKEKCLPPRNKRREIDNENMNNIK